MSRHLYSTKFIILAFIVSIMFHAMIVATIYLVPDSAAPASIPVNIVNLPADALKQLPPLPTAGPRSSGSPRRAAPARSAAGLFPKQPVPEKQVPPAAVPKPKKFGGSDDVTLPRTGSPRTGIPEGAEQGKETGKATEGGKPGAGTHEHKGGPLPFLSQNDIDQLARKGMPAQKAGRRLGNARYGRVQVHLVQPVAQDQGGERPQYPEARGGIRVQGTLFIKFDILKDGSLGAFRDDEVIGVQDPRRRSGAFDPRFRSVPAPAVRDGTWTATPSARRSFSIWARATSDDGPHQDRRGLCPDRPAAALQVELRAGHARRLGCLPRSPSTCIGPFNSASSR